MKLSRPTGFGGVLLEKMLCGNMQQTTLDGGVRVGHTRKGWVVGNP